MPTYIVLGKYTEEGIEKIKESPERLEKAREVVKQLGGEIKEFYYTMGQYDFVAITEGKDNETTMKALFAIGSGGAINTETLVAIRADKGAELIKGLP